MLVLSRRTGEKIWIGENISITIVRVSDGSVRVGIDAPPEMAVLRDELKKKMESEQVSLLINERKSAEQIRPS